MTDYQYNNLITGLAMFFCIINGVIVYFGGQILSRLDELLSKKNKKSS